jgi:hypothetical protein
MRGYPATCRKRRRSPNLFPTRRLRAAARTRHSGLMRRSGRWRRPRELRLARSTKPLAKLNDIGGEHAALVQKWQTTGANGAEELGYAKQAFQYVVNERPDLIAKFDQNGLGVDPSVLEFLAQHGRLRAGMMGDFSVAQNSSRSTGTPQRAMPRGQSAAQAELNRIFEQTPPGTAGYFKAPCRRASVS